jgi:hypothetical protein
MYLPLTAMEDQQIMSNKKKPVFKQTPLYLLENIIIITYVVCFVVPIS